MVVACDFLSGGGEGKMMSIYGMAVAVRRWWVFKELLFILKVGNYVLFLADCFAWCIVYCCVMLRSVTFMLFRGLKQRTEK